jgi:glycosyltransferase involved in cell wall biosynthesis
MPVEPLPTNRVAALLSEPLVSVVIPSFNRQACLRRAIDSVIAQSYRPIEIIVVDDGSTDGTIDTFTGLECGVPFLFHPLESNMGAAIARNRGVELANGPFIAFLDSDDLWHPEKIARQMAALAQHGETYGGCYTGILSLDEQGQPCGISRATDEGDIHAALLNHNVVGSTSCVLVRRDLLLQQGGFLPGLRSCQDWELWTRLARITRFACVPELLTTLIIATQGRITSSGRNRLSGHLYMYRTHLRAAFRTGAAEPDLFLAIMGEIFMQNGRPDYAARVLGTNWRAKPRSPKRLVVYVMAKLRVKTALFFKVSEKIGQIENYLRPSSIRKVASDT